MKVVVIGGSGHIGTYLVITSIQAEVVIDLINFKLEDTKSLVEFLKSSKITHYIFCSSIWAFGRSTILPITEDQTKFPLCEYGREKVKCEEYLLQLYEKEKFPCTIIYPGQISGPGWAIVSPVANDNYWLFNDIRLGKQIALPNFGMETLHFVHAEDVAQLFLKVINHGNALGQSFFAVGKESITLLGFTQLLFRHFGKEENIEFLPWHEWAEASGNEEHIEKTYLHLARSGIFSIEKARKLID